MARLAVSIVQMLSVRLDEEETRLTKHLGARVRTRTLF